MAPLRIWRHYSWNTSALFLGVAVVSVIVLVWMGIRLVQQDRALEAQRLEEQRDTAADRIIVALEKSLTSEERKLLEAPAVSFESVGEDALLFIADPDEIRVWPDNALLYYPVITPDQEASSHLFAKAERAEFINLDYENAISVLQHFSKAKDPVIRAGAQLRLARNLRKVGRPEEALLIYNKLAKSSYPEISISGVPAELVARRSRCVLLEQLDNMEQLKQETQSLLDDLKGGRWQIDRASYLYYSRQAMQWLNQEVESDAGQQALADAVLWLWQKWESLGDSEQDSSGRRSFTISGTTVTALWRMSENRLAAIVAGPGYQQCQWFDPLFKDHDFSAFRIGLKDSDGTQIYGNKPPNGVPVTTRLASVPGLPWDIALVNANLEADLSQFAQRRRLMMMGMGMLALLVIAASYLIGRAVSRELAAAKLQADFVSAVSHEFRTPLTSMRQFTEMLIEDEDLPKEKRLAFYCAQERATRRLSRLVESLLDFGRMEAGARPYKLEKLDVGQLVRTVVEEFRNEADSNTLMLDCSIPEDGVSVKGDWDALSQAIWNLLDNAVKYSSDHPKVHVELKAGEPVAIRVRDEGLGIPASEKDRILRKFIRGSRAKAYGIKGTGIGLAIVKHIVDAHAGKVLIDSELGKGSTFTVLLPGGG